MKSARRFCFLVMAFALSGPSVFGQWESVMETQYFSDGTLKAATKNTHYAETEGSPFFYDNWTPGQASLSDGKTYKGVLLKYDQVTNTLMFKYALTDSPMVFKFRPLAFELNYIDTTPFIAEFANGFQTVDGSTAGSFYQVLTGGKTKLLKRCVKTMTEVQAFGTNETRKRINEVTHYYLTKDMLPVRVKRDKKSVLNVLAAKADQLKAYMTKNDIDLDNEIDFVRLITYYNTL